MFRVMISIRLIYNIKLIFLCSSFRMVIWVSVVIIIISVVSSIGFLLMLMMLFDIMKLKCLLVKVVV